MVFKYFVLSMLGILVRFFSLRAHVFVILFYLSRLVFGHEWVGDGGGRGGGGTHTGCWLRGVGMEDRGGRDSIVSGGGGRGEFSLCLILF